jgi:hypothetical protein
MEASDATDTKHLISMEHLSYNMKKIDRFRTIIFIIGGMICGVSGITGLDGLIFFLVMSLITSVVLLIKIGFNLKGYFNSSIFSFLFQGMRLTSMSFLLFWTLSFALVYIY